MTDPDPGADRGVDEALEETFPASDAPGNTGETGIRIGEAPTPARAAVVDNVALQRFELRVDGDIAVLQYERNDGALSLVHTEVPERLRGRHLGDLLVQAALDSARAAGLRIVAVCPFVRSYMRKHRTA